MLCGVRSWGICPRIKEEPWFNLVAAWLKQFRPSYKNLPTNQKLWKIWWKGQRLSRVQQNTGQSASTGPIFSSNLEYFRRRRFQANCSKVTMERNSYLVPLKYCGSLKGSSGLFVQWLSCLTHAESWTQPHQASCILCMSLPGLSKLMSTGSS